MAVYEPGLVRPGHLSLRRDNIWENWTWMYEAELYLELVFALKSLGNGPCCVHSHGVALQAQRSQALVLLDLTDQLLH